MKKLLSVLLFVFLTAGTTFAQNTVVVGGTGSNQHLLREIAMDFMKNNPGINIEVPDSIGSSGGIKAVIKGGIDIGRVARELKDSEKKNGLVYKEFALSPVVFSSNPGIKINNLSEKQIVEIYEGKINNWKELGGADSKIYVIGREDKDSSLGVIKKSIEEFRNIKYREKILIVNKDNMMVQKLKQKPGTIGFGTLANMEAANLNVINIDNIKPDDSGYKLQTRFAFVYFPDQIKPEAGKFIDYVFSKKGAAVIEKNYCIPVN